MVVADGERVIFQCEVKGMPPPAVMWYKGNKILRNCADFLQKFDGCRATMLITEVFPDDEGRYSCLVKNEAGEAKTTCYLTVKGNNTYSL